MKDSSKHQTNTLEIKGKHAHTFLVLNTSTYILAAICFMIYTTQQSYTFAEGESDLGYDLASINTSVTVGTACTLTGTISSPHTDNISNGVYSDNIGTTVLNTTCNDSGGYALYAIGYTNNEFGNTALMSDINNAYDIPTGTATSGNTSTWAMKLAQVSGTTPATIENGYDAYNIVPDSYTKVATLNIVTDPASTSSPTGSSVSTTYSVYISPTQPAGTYVGKVKYTLVHPSTASPPIFMQNTAAIKARLTNEGDTMQAIDRRDGKKYWITKLADGNIWMTQNLDFDIDSTKTYTPADTDITTNWTPVRSTATDSTWDTSSTGYTSPNSYDPGNVYWDSNVTTSSGTISNRTVTNPSTTPGGTHYHIGNYYNWTAAIAMSDSGSYITQYQNVDQSICPAGWRLPVYSGDKSFEKLKSKQDLTAGASGNVQNSPTYLIYGSGWGGDPQETGMGSEGHYWSNTVYGKYASYVLTLNFRYNSVEPQSAGMGGVRMFGKNVRCVAR